MTLMKLYVAGSSRERPRYREAVRGIESSITFDWEAGFRRYETALRAGDDVGAAQIFKESRERCVEGIERSYAFIMLIPETPSRGAWFEAGYAYHRAIEHGLHLYSVGDASRLDIWGPCFDAHFDTMSACLAHLRIERSES